jgi:hypothetical protein
MKKIFTYLLVCMMSALVFYGGAGVNVISFCCDDCRREGLTVIAKDNCCDTGKNGCAKNHTPDNTRFPHADCTDHPEEGDCCSFKRIDFEWNTHNVTEWTSLLSSQTVDLPVCRHFISLPDISEIQNEWFLHKPPPLETPEQYLSKLTTLLI